MIIELLFDEKNYRKQMQLLYDLAYKRKLKYYKNSHYLGFALSIIGVFMIIDKRNLGYVFIVFGLGIIIPYFSVYFKHISMSKKFLLEQNETIKVYKENPKSIWEFTEETLKYSGIINEKTIEWKDFLTYTAVEDTIFMFTKTFEPLVIGKSEMEEESYRKVLEFVECKIVK